MSRLITWIKLLIYPAPLKLEVIEELACEHDVYDPSQDEERILKGEIESYFD